MPDGSMGFAGDETAVPPGATILKQSSGRGSMNIVTPLSQSDEAPSPEELKAVVRARCVAKWHDDYERMEYCTRQRTRHALNYRELLLGHPPGSEGRAIVLDCRDEWSNGSAVDYARAASCARKRHAAFVRSHGGNPASLSLDTGPSRAERERERRYRARQERLDRLRDEREAQEEELLRGQAIWGPKYDRALRELERAEDRTRSILNTMRRRGCRADSLACGGLEDRLAEARRKEAEKRRYLNRGLVDECRRAGCQPSWLH